MLMTKENYKAYMKEFKRVLKDGKVPICPKCKKPMVNAIDSITKKISKYLWKCDCEDMKDFRLSVG